MVVTNTEKGYVKIFHFSNFCFLFYLECFFGVLSIVLYTSKNPYIPLVRVSGHF